MTHPPCPCPLQSADPVPLQRPQDHVLTHGGGDGELYITVQYGTVQCTGDREHEGAHPTLRPGQRGRLPRPLPRLLPTGRLQGRQVRGQDQRIWAKASESSILY